MEGLTEGRIAHFVMPNGQHRCAIIVKVWSKAGGVVNMTVFTDWSNDIMGNESESFNNAISSGILWRTSVQYSEAHEPNTWHWVEPA